MELNNHQENIYKAFGYSIIARVQADLNALIKEKTDKENTIQEKKDKKISFNFKREGDVKKINEEIEYKTNYIQMIKENYAKFGINIDDYSSEKFENSLKETFNSAMKVEKINFLFQTIYAPLYLDLSTQKELYDEEEKNDSLSTICTYLGLKSDEYKDLLSLVKESDRDIEGDLGNDLIKVIRKNSDLIHYISPLSKPLLVGNTYNDLNRDGEINQYQNCSLINLITLTSIEPVVLLEKLNGFNFDVLGKSSTILNINLLVALLNIKICFNENKSMNDLIESLIKLVLKESVNYELGILTQKSKDDSKKNSETKFKLFSLMSEAILEVTGL